MKKHKGLFWLALIVLALVIATLTGLVKFPIMLILGIVLLFGLLAAAFGLRWYTKHAATDPTLTPDEASGFKKAGNISTIYLVAAWLFSLPALFDGGIAITVAVVLGLAMVVLCVLASIAMDGVPDSWVEEAKLPGLAALPDFTDASPVRWGRRGLAIVMFGLFILFIVISGGGGSQAGAGMGLAPTPPASIASVASTTPAAAPVPTTVAPTTAPATVDTTPPATTLPPTSAAPATTPAASPTPATSVAASTVANPGCNAPDLTSYQKWSAQPFYAGTAKRPSNVEFCDGNGVWQDWSTVQPVQPVPTRCYLGYQELGVEGYSYYLVKFSNHADAKTYLVRTKD